ncbi:MAG: DUF5686 and carboxypeptidase regulatory-like domain-containing protein [Crocinitomicaceae bacterium]|nr:DUF5686 and carboxypeptidase regulatory-like domain-containing protein [Crocinitomicaceae bacterium]
MKQFLLALTLLISYNLSAQFIVEGTVVDEYDQPIPGVRVAIENSTYAVPTNAKGKFFMELDNGGITVFKISMIGFEPLIDSVDVVEGNTQVEFKLRETAAELGTVEIYADKKDIAKEVIGNVMDRKKELYKQYESYQCNTYIKTSLDEESRVPAFMQQGEESLEEKSRMNFIESYSITRFKQNSTYKETILAHHDYSDKEASQVVVAADFTDPNALVPTQVVEYNPFIFFEKVEDGDINLYQNLLELPKISSRPLVSPLAVNGFINYKYILKSIFNEDGYKIYEIDVEPRFKEAPLFSGSLYIIDSLWVIKSMDLSINSSAMEYFSSFRIIQDYEEIDGRWVPVRREFSYEIKELQTLILGNTRVDHDHYEFDVAFDKNEFKNVIMEYEEDAFDKDSMYWVNTRPIQLNSDELDYIHERDSVQRVVTSNTYIDSVNREYNRITFWDVTLNGIGFRSREKKQEIYFNSVLDQIKIFGMGGFRYAPSVYYEKEFENAQAINVDGTIDYGFRNRDLKGSLGVEYTYLPKHFGSFKVSGGDIYDLVTYDQNIVGLLSTQNYVRKTFVGVSKRFEVVNGLYARGSFDYSTRRSIGELDYGWWQDTLIQIGLWQLPQPFETYTVSIFELELLYRFKQKYIVKGNKKLIIGTEYPELKFTYKRGIPGLFGSDINFNFAEIGVSDEVEFATMGNMKWNFLAGSFFGSNLGEIRFIEHKFFRGSDQLFFAQPLKYLQLLDTTFSTVRPYVQAFAIHHFNGAILGKIPLINKLKLELVAGGGLLFIEEADYKHIEFYGGIERKFKIKKQLFKVGVYYAVREGSATSEIINFKVGIDFFNSFTNSWSY